MPTYSTPYNGPVGHVGLQERQRICEGVVGAVEWSERGAWGYCTCPGVQFHHNKNGRRDCRVYAEETPGAGRSGGALPPGVTCLHTSCGSAIEEASKRIRSLIGKAKVSASGGMSHGTAVPRGTFRAVENARRAEQHASASVAQVTPLRTARTPVFKFSEKGKPVVRTARTDNSRPYTLYAQAHMRTHEAVRSSEMPSEPSTGVAKKQATAPFPAQPKRAMPPADLAGKVFCPVRLAWITRAQWVQEQADKPLTS